MGRLVPSVCMQQPCVFGEHQAATGGDGSSWLFLVLADDVRQFLEWPVIICKVVFQHGPCLEGWQGGLETRLVVEKAEWVWEHTGCQEVKSFGRLLHEQRGNQNVVGVVAAQFNLSPANPRKLYVVWQRLSTVLLHILGWDKKLQSLPFPESLEIKSVPGVCHKEMTAGFSDTEENQCQQLDAPGHLR